MRLEFPHSDIPDLVVDTGRSDVVEFDTSYNEYSPATLERKDVERLVAALTEWLDRPA